MTYAFTANPTTQSRGGVLTVAGQAVTITQAAGCGYSISPASGSVGAAQATGTVSITAGGGCAWTASSPASWITFSTSTSGSRQRQRRLRRRGQHQQQLRSATLTVAGQPFVLTQAGASCTATLNPATQNIGATGATNASVDVSLPGGCAWTAVPSASWITVLTGASGTGNGTVTYRVDPNPAGASRSGTIAIGGQLLTVTQAAAPCTATLSPTSDSTTEAGGNRVVSVTIPSACSWTAASNVSWMTVTAGAGPNTSGSAAVTYSVAANTSTSSRSGTLTIAGQTFTVTQAGITCSYTVNPTTASAVAGAGSGTVTVTSPTGCAWTASSSVSWMSITAGASGSGSGSVTYAFTANPTTQSRGGRADRGRPGRDHHPGCRLRLQHFAGERIGRSGPGDRDGQHHRRWRVRVDGVEPGELDHVQHADVRHRQRQRRLRGRGQHQQQLAVGHASPLLASPSSSPRRGPRAMPR